MTPEIKTSILKMQRESYQQGRLDAIKSVIQGLHKIFPDKDESVHVSMIFQILEGSLDVIQRDNTI